MSGFSRIDCVGDFVLPRPDDCLPNHALAGASLYGVRVLLDECLLDRRQLRFPRSKKKRMRRKWEKNKRNWGVVPSGDVLAFNGAVLMHPATFRKLKAKIAKTNPIGTASRINLF